MNKNKIRYCTLLLINDYNDYNIKDDNESIRVKILNKFEDIRISCKINVKDITDNYYKIDKPHIIIHCTILLIDNDNHGKIFTFKKKLYYISCVDDKHYDYDDYDDYDYDDYLDDDYDDDDCFDDNYLDDFIIMMKN